ADWRALRAVRHPDRAATVHEPVEPFLSEVPATALNDRAVPCGSGVWAQAQPQAEGRGHAAGTPRSALRRRTTPRTTAAIAAAPAAAMTTSTATPLTA